jgi:hypothetical protein
MGPATQDGFYFDFEPIGDFKVSENDFEAIEAEMKKIVTEEREKLVKNIGSEFVALQLDHFPDGTCLELPVYSYTTKRDSVVTVKNFRPIVKATLSFQKPDGYLIPLSNSKLVEWVKKHGFTLTDPGDVNKLTLEQIKLLSVDSVNYEGDITAFPNVTVSPAGDNINLKNYLYVPTSQLKGNLLVIALEPQSVLGLATYSQFDFLMKAQSVYPIIKVRKNENREN